MWKAIKKYIKKSSKDYLDTEEKSSEVINLEKVLSGDEEVSADTLNTLIDDTFHILFVPFEEKNEAKKLGAKWFADIKKWGVPFGYKITPFKKWLPKLDIELVPSTCWFSNIRTILSDGQWKMVSKIVRQKNNYTCLFCGIKDIPKNIHCHEEWEYDHKNKTQYLKRFVSICYKCHYVKHMGKSNVDGKGAMAKTQLMKVNGLNEMDAELYIENEFHLWKVRSLFEWDLDISKLEKMGFKKLFYKFSERPTKDNPLHQFS